MDTTTEILKGIDEVVSESSGPCRESDPDIDNITNTQEVIRAIGVETESLQNENQQLAAIDHIHGDQKMLVVKDSKDNSPEDTSKFIADEGKPKSSKEFFSVEQNSMEFLSNQNEEKIIDKPRTCTSDLTLKRQSDDIAVDYIPVSLDPLSSIKTEIENENTNQECAKENLEKTECKTKVIQHQGTGTISLIPDIEEQPPAKRQKTCHADDDTEKSTQEVDSSDDIRTSPGDDLYIAKKVSPTADRPEPSNSSTQDSDTNSSYSSSVYKFEGPPHQLTGAWGCFMSDSCNNYLRGCKWAPDGTCLLTTTNNNCVQVFDMPEQLYDTGREYTQLDEMVPVLKMKEADTIYDYCWYSKMSSSDPDKACLAVTSRSTPVHLFDAFTGNLKSSYRAYSQVDELVAAYSLSFDPTGSKLYCGFNKMIRVFDVNRPGRECVNRPTYAKEGQSGIISCIAHSPTETGLYAAGSYARSIALYKETKGEMICMFEGQQGGVTHIIFSPDGTKLYSGGRKDNEILCWDLRNPGRILYTMERKVYTNQRIYFDITQDGRFVISGCHDGFVRVWDTLKSPVQYEGVQEPILPAAMSYKAHSDTVNGVSLHPYLPIVVTSSGQRHYPSFNDSSDENTDAEDDSELIDNSLRLWRIT